MTYATDHFTTRRIQRDFGATLRAGGGFQRLGDETATAAAQAAAAQQERRIQQGEIVWEEGRAPHDPFTTFNSSVHTVCSLLIAEALGFLSVGEKYTGGVGCGGRPPRASFLGVRSLSLVLADFGTFVFGFILLISFRCSGLP